MNSKPLKMIHIILGGMLAVYAVVLLFCRVVHTGVFLVLLLGLALLAFGIFKLPGWLKTLVWCGVGVAAVCIGLLFGYGNKDTVTYREDVLYVLGGGLKKEAPNAELARRLDRAVLYYEKNPDALIVVTGGQGPNEIITEGLAMERYLIERGVPGEQILREEASTSTYENFTYSRKLLAERIGEEHTAAFITTDYHIYRAERLAVLAGYETVTHCHCDSPARNIIAAGLREILAVVKLWVFRC